MSASNSIHIMGRITRDLELKYTASGVVSVATRTATETTPRILSAALHGAQRRNLSQNTFARAQ